MKSKTHSANGVPPLKSSVRRKVPPLNDEHKKIIRKWLEHRLQMYENGLIRAKQAHRIKASEYTVNQLKFFDVAVGVAKQLIAYVSPYKKAWKDRAQIGRATSDAATVAAAD